MKLLLLCSFIFFAACAGLKRSPSSIKKTDSLFNLINSEEVLKANYSFELVSLFGLNDRKVIFKTFEISDDSAKKAVDAWESDLNGYLSVYKEDIKLRSGNRDVQVRIRDLTRLQQALSLLAKSGESSEKVLRKQIELVTAFNQNFKSIESFNYDGASVPLDFDSEQRHKVSFADSSFWQGTSERKRPLSPVDVTTEEFAGRPCRAESSDTLNSVKLSCANLQFKILPQTSPKVSAFNSILYRRLGYNAAPVVFVSDLPLLYERGLLPALKKLNVRFSAIFKNGEAASFEGLVSKLLPYCKARNETCFSPSALFDAQVENQIEQLVLSDVAINLENGDHVFGSWAYDELDHKYRPEVKALFFVSAFTGNSDLRKESNAVVWSAKNFTVTHQLQNLNSGLGGVRPGSPMNLNSFKWEVLKLKRQKGKDVFVFDGYRPSFKRPAFSEVTADDAKWAVRQIASLSEQELTEALALSGFSAAELLLAREKLISIQKNMIETLGLEQEFTKITERKIEKNINYRITGQPALFEITANRRIQVPEQNDELFNGTLKKSLPSLLENKRKISNTVDE